MAVTKRRSFGRRRLLGTAEANADRLRLACLQVYVPRDTIPHGTLIKASARSLAFGWTGR